MARIALFSDYELSEGLKNQERKLIDEIGGIHPNSLLNAGIDVLVQQLETKYLIEPPELLEDQIHVDQNEAAIDVSRDPFRIIIDRSEPHYITGTQVSFIVPFKGEAVLFRYQPRSYSLSPPFAEVNANELVFKYSGLNPDPEKFKNDFQRELGQVKDYLRT